MNWFLIYVLSILNGVYFVCAIVALLILLWSLTFMPSEYERDMEKREREYADVRRRAARAIPFIVAFALIPSRDSLIQSYVMTEGQKVLTAANAKEAADAVVQRIDLLVEAMQGKAVK